ncbi:hypothetical protein [Desulfoscipio gibsoniae]
MDLEGTLSGGLHGIAASQTVEQYVVEASGSEAKHIIDLLQAEAQGRLVVLPCTVGDRLYSYATHMGYEGYSSFTCCRKCRMTFLHRQKQYYPSIRLRQNRISHP